MEKTNDMRLELIDNNIVAIVGENKSWYCKRFLERISDFLVFENFDDYFFKRKAQYKVAKQESEDRDHQILGYIITVAGCCYVKVSSEVMDLYLRREEEWQRERAARLEREEQERKKREEEREKNDPIVYKGMRRSDIKRAIMYGNFGAVDIEESVVFELLSEGSL